MKQFISKNHQNINLARIKRDGNLEELFQHERIIKTERSKQFLLNFNLIQLPIDLPEVYNKLLIRFKLIQTVTPQFDKNNQI